MPVGQLFHLPVGATERIARAMMRLKDEGILDLSRGTIKILDVNRLFQAGQINQHYLHLQRESKHPGVTQ